MKWIEFDYTDLKAEDTKLLIKSIEGIEVLAYHPAWIHEDFNPTGVTVGYFQEGEDGYSFIHAEWDPTQDTWFDKVDFMPVCYSLKQSPEIIIADLAKRYDNLLTLEMSQEIADFVKSHGHVIMFDYETKHAYSLNGDDWFKIKIKDDGTIAASSN